MATQKIDNLEIWEAVEKTDPKLTKWVNKKGGRTAIKPQSQIKAATALFGPIGTGWGHKDEQIFAINGTIIYQAILWYVYKGAGGEFPICSSVAANADPEDSIKSVSTDAITKGLSRLGFNSDVFEGKFGRDGKTSDPAATNTEASKNERIAAARAKEADQTETSGLRQPDRPRHRQNAHLLRPPSKQDTGKGESSCRV
jgi:hypothetical protein